MSMDTRTEKGPARLSRQLRLLSLFFCAGVACASATVANTGSSTISSINAYTELGSGDVIFQLTTNGISACNLGFWIRATDPGAKTVVAEVLAAYHNGVPVVVAADNATIWSGSTSGSACLVVAVVS